MAFTTKQDQVADIIRERIIVGDFRRGQKLKQADLAAELGVSITPVREALLMLQAEGYVRGVSHKGLVVPELEPERAREIFELRLNLERELTSVALSRLTPGRLQELKDIQRKLTFAVEAGDLQTVRTTNYHFHFHLYEIADRPQTLHFVRVLWAKYPFTQQDVRRSRPLHMRSEHDLFLEKIEEDDLTGATEAMVEHIRRGWKQIHASRQHDPADAASASARPSLKTASLQSAGQRSASRAGKASASRPASTRAADRA